MTVHVEIDRLRLTGVHMPPGAVDELRGELQHAISAELAPVAVPGAPVPAELVASSVRRVVAATVERRGS